MVGKQIIRAALSKKRKPESSENTPQKGDALVQSCSGALWCSHVSAGEKKKATKAARGRPVGSCSKPGHKNPQWLKPGALFAKNDREVMCEWSSDEHLLKGPNESYLWINFCRSRDALEDSELEEWEAVETGEFVQVAPSGLAREAK